MIARMTADGVITIEPQNGTEVVALKAWMVQNRISMPDTTAPNNADGTVWRGAALEVMIKD